MTLVAMNQFGRTLTDREFGKSVAATILKNYPFPVTLDFKGVISLGSSCGDEIINVIIGKQGAKLRVLNANQAIMACLEKVALDSKITVSFDLDP
mgnify:CR=1 FL=1